MCDIFETRNLNYNLRSQTNIIRTLLILPVLDWMIYNK